MIGKVLSVNVFHRSMEVATDCGRTLIVRKVRNIKDIRSAFDAGPSDGTTLRVEMHGITLGPVASRVADPTTVGRIARNAGIPDVYGMLDRANDPQTDDAERDAILTRIRSAISDCFDLTYVSQRRCGLTVGNWRIVDSDDSRLRHATCESVTLIGITLNRGRFTMPLVTSSGQSAASDGWRKEPL